MLYRYIWLAIICFACSHAEGQQIHLEQRGIYSYQGQQYKRAEMKSIFSQHPVSQDKYEQYLSLRKYAKRNRNVGGALMLISPLMTFVAAAGAIDRRLQGAGGLAIFSIATFTVGTGLVIYSFRRKQYLLDDAVTTFNSRTNQSLQLGVTPNGYGLVYAF